MLGKMWSRTKAKACPLSFPTELQTARPIVEMGSYCLPPPPHLGMVGWLQHKERRGVERANTLSHAWLSVSLEALVKTQCTVCQCQTMCKCERQADGAHALSGPISSSLPWDGEVGVKGFGRRRDMFLQPFLTGKIIGKPLSPQLKPSCWLEHSKCLN